MNRKLLSLIVLSTLHMTAIEPENNEILEGKIDHISHKRYMESQNSPSKGDGANIMVKSYVDEIIEKLRDKREHMKIDELVGYYNSEEKWYLDSLYSFLGGRDMTPVSIDVRLSDALLDLCYKNVLEMGIIRYFCWETKIGQDNQFMHMLDNSISSSLDMIKRVKNHEGEIHILQIIEDMQSCFKSYMSFFEHIQYTNEANRRELLEDMREIINPILRKLLFLQVYYKGPASEFKERMILEETSFKQLESEHQLERELANPPTPETELQSIMNKFPFRVYKDYFCNLKCYRIRALAYHMAPDLLVYNTKSYDKDTATLYKSFK